MSEWRQAQLGEVVTFTTGKLDSNAAVPNGYYPFFTCSQETLRTNTYSFDDECVLLAGNNANGIYALKYFHGKFDAYQRTYVIRSRNTSVLLTRFLHYALRPKLSEFRRVSTGAATKFLTLTILNAAKISVPPPPVQQRIAGILSTYDDLIENCARRIRVLDEMARCLYREWFVLFRYPGHEKTSLVDSPLGRIPKGWATKAVGQFGAVITGKTPSKGNPDFYGADVPFVKTPDMHGNMFILETSECLSTLGADSQASKTLSPGSICVSCIGTIGAVALTTKRCQTNQQINALVPADPTNRELLFLRLQDSKRTLENLGANGATMGNVNKSKFETMSIVWPPEDLLADFHRLVEPMFSGILGLMREVHSLRTTRDALLPRLLSGQLSVEDAA